MSRIILFLLTTIVLTGCQKAGRYPKTVKAPAAADPKVAAAISQWLAPPEKDKDSPKEVPIEFVSSDKAEWRDLPKFWNEIVLKDDAAGRVKIKVPRGLPDPTPLIPAANPPTYAKWRLGKKIFFERALLPNAPQMACADCHVPKLSFTDGRQVSSEGTRNTLSLLNVAYNRDQFWDGRVRTLEETLMPSLDEPDAGGGRIKAMKTHRWPGLADRLDQVPEYRQEFIDAFGIRRVTQDAVAKALATYLRTILSGDSVYDKARAAIPPFKDAAPTVEQFKAVLTDDDFKRMADVLPPMTVANRDDLAAKIAQGQAVFLGKGACATCHPPGLFTNHQFYNTSIGDSRIWETQNVTGKETGRFAALPVGAKDFAMRGAYRTPTLRNLSSTAPYMHTGGLTTIPVVIDKYLTLYDEPLMAQPLRDLLGGARSSLNRFDSDDCRALECFLRSLDGQPVESIVMQR